MLALRRGLQIDQIVGRVSHQLPVKIGEAILFDLGGEFLLQLLLGLRPQF